MPRPTGVLATAFRRPAARKVAVKAGSGQIAGTVFTGGASEGFLYSNGTLTSLGSFLAAAINDNGQIVADTTGNHALLLTPA